MVDDIAHSDSAVDLCKAWREDNSCEEGKLNYFCSDRKKFKVEVMDPIIEKYHMLYAQDLA